MWWWYKQRAVQRTLSSWIADNRMGLYNSCSLTGHLLLSQNKWIQDHPKKHGKGYEALFDIICPDHPENDTYPLLLIRERLAQGEHKSISDYLNECVNYLKLTTYLTDVSVNVNNSCKRKTFIGNLCQGKGFLDKTYDKCHSNEPTKWAMYWQGNLVGTFESVAKQIRPSCHIWNHGSPVPKKELTFNCQPPRQKPPPPLSKSVLMAKKVQSIDVFDAEDPTCVKQCIWPQYNQLCKCNCSKQYLWHIQTMRCLQ